MSDDGRARRWCFTLNGTVAQLCSALRTLHALDEHAYVRLCYQVERGSTDGRLHIQGFVVFDKLKRLTQVRKWGGTGVGGRSHWEVARGTPEQCETYCAKVGPGGHAGEEGAAELLEGGWTLGCGPWKLGDCIVEERGKRTDLMAVAEALVSGAPAEDVMVQFPSCGLRYSRHMKDFEFHLMKKRAQEPRQVVVDVYVGKTGCGKSHKAFTENPGCYVVCAPNTKGGALWFTGYSGEKVIVLDEFRPSWMTYDYLLRLTDKWPLQIQSKGSACWALWTKVVITSTHHPGTWYDAGEFAGGELARRITRTVELRARDEGGPAEDMEVAPVPDGTGTQVGGNTMPPTCVPLPTEDHRMTARPDLEARMTARFRALEEAYKSGW